MNSRDMKIAEAVRRAQWCTGDGLLSDAELTEIIASVPVAVEPVAYLIERHAFRVSQDGQDAEGLDWLEVTEAGDTNAFAVFTAPPDAASIRRSAIEECIELCVALGKGWDHQTGKPIPCCYTSADAIRALLDKEPAPSKERVFC